MNLQQLNLEYDKLQKKYGAKGKHSFNSCGINELFNGVGAHGCGAPPEIKSHGNKKRQAFFKGVFSEQGCTKR